MKADPIMNISTSKLVERSAWVGFALILLLAPYIFHENRGLSVLSQIGTVMIFGLSYNMLLGQGGMLSFGHAVYSGLGAFMAIHAMNLSGKSGFPCPVSLIPLVGGLAGMFFGILFGYVTTRKSGTTFAMITLGIVELVFACSLMFPGFFGGEGGITTNRVIGQPVLGISFGPQIQVYYLIAAWLFVSTIAMYAFTRTPLGRIINAVRDNPERVEFVGYDAQWVRYLTLIISAFFAGISGALSAINFEIVSAENVSAVRSGAVLLFTFIGGIGFFFGPMIGAVIGVFMSVLLSEYSPAWQLYLGVFFIIMVLRVPGGVASLLMRLLHLITHKQFAQAAPYLCKNLMGGVLGSVGFILLVEMIYHHKANSEKPLTLLGWVVHTQSAWMWLFAIILLLAGLMVLYRTAQHAKEAQ